MKFRVLGVVLIIAVFLVALGSSRMNDDMLNRTHQHLEYKEKTVDADDTSGFSTHLPIIKLDMNGQEPTVYSVEYENGVPDALSDDIVGTVEVIDNDEMYNHLSDSPTMKVWSYIRVRGNSSKWHDKKNYKLSFIFKDGTENKTEELLGMEPYDEWALHGPYLDKSLIRNYMCMNVTGQIMPYTPDVRFCELFVNGEYKGVYLAMETVGRAEGRVDIHPYDEGKPYSSYIVQANWYSDSPNNFYPFTSYTKMMDYFTAMRIVYPGETLTPEVKEYITQDISSFEKALYSFDYDEEFGYKSFYDVDSFVDYAIINEFFQNYDAGSISTFFYKDLGDKLHIGPVWDFNSAFDNFSKPVPEFSVVRTVRYNMMMKDEDFVEKLIRRYRVLRESVLSEEYLINYIDETVAFLGPAVERNFEVWSDSFDYENMQAEIRVDYEWRNPFDHDEAVEQLKEFVRDRGSWLDEHIETLRQYCHESAVKKYNH